jgi:excisionase family DNA binding protein
MDEPVKRSTYDVEEAARILGIGRSAAYEGIRRGEIPALRIGKRLVVPHAALERLLEGRVLSGA